MNKAEAIALLEELFEKAEVQDRLVIDQILKGIEKKLTVPDNSYIGCLLSAEKAVSKDSCTITIPISSLVHNNLNIVHGGIIATLADSAMGILANEVLETGYAAVTTQLNTHYLAPGNGESLSCTARFLHKGSKTMVLEAEVFREDGKKAAFATGSFFVVPANK
ncbi:PaaI family thioesterase [Bacillus massilinigeriensis]|uniref:PaaI family thioesterase n=1 Tax=Bacillus mediterraneensis TaxID=1805474 RepID=UPI0008F8C61C|nr:PaaI family thioesterase [Bacillus mediterraneensis]